MKTTIQAVVDHDGATARKRRGHVTIAIADDEGTEIDLLFYDSESTERFLAAAVLAAEDMADIERSRKFGEDGAR